jgi:Protein of unknown function (DUF1566)
MTQQPSKKEISLGEDFGDVIVKVNRATINVSAAGYVIADSPSGVEWRVANDENKAAASAEPMCREERIERRIGDKMPDGTIYAGISPDTHKPMYATSADAKLTYTFNQAQNYAARLSNLNANGHDDWRVPTKGELNVLFNNRAAIGGFNISGSGPAGWYWSASPGNQWGAWGQQFYDGRQYDIFNDHLMSVRCVR